MEKIEREVAPNQIGFPYRTMTLQELIDFWLKQVAPRLADHVFMWTTQRWFVPAVTQVFPAIGFTYILQFTWKKPGGFQPFGLPQFNSEFVLYGRKGSPKFIDLTNFMCAFDAPRREHSRKPDLFYDTIKRVTTGNRIDIFSREPREGFAQFGNEITKFTELAG
jgi:N6-adenosine-specific RNA methylase IME4